MSLIPFRVPVRKCRLLCRLCVVPQTRSSQSFGTGSVQAISQVHGGQKLSGLSGFLVKPASVPSLTVCMPVASVLTKCQEEVSRVSAIHPGSFRPKCDKNGDYMPLQCYGSIGYCWCAFPNGTEVPHTRSRGQPNCSGKQCHSAARKELEGAGARAPFKRRDPRPRGSHSALHFSLTFMSTFMRLQFCHHFGPQT